ncbi:MAG TPA: hypothetical protein VGR73_21200 [Bryobacteraceae bacterium]|nr:hypothetical protein [Bryobacteraceae bacterium]
MRVRPLLVAGLIASLVAVAEVPADVLRVFADVAEALANDDASGFLDQFDNNMPGYADLRANVEGLLNANEVISTVEAISDQGEDGKRSLELDWLLALNEKNAVGGRKETRRGVLKCSVERRGKRWKIVALEPIDFFRP